jgi:DNA invertase Pin-like site-specific DNA recombinase
MRRVESGKKIGRGQAFHSLTEAIDTTKPTGRATWQMIGVLAELERSLISERTRAGVKAAQRKVKLTAEQINRARKPFDEGEARQYVADLLNVGRSTLYWALAS